MGEEGQEAGKKMEFVVLVGSGKSDRPFPECLTD